MGFFTALGFGKGFFILLLVDLLPAVFFMDFFLAVLLLETMLLADLFFAFFACVEGLKGSY